MLENLSANQAANASPWHPLARLAFRFLLLYFGMFTLRMVTWIALGGDLPWTSSLYRWVAAKLFGTEIHFVTGDSSDTAYDYGIIATHLILSLIGTMVWSILGRRQIAYPRLFDAQWMAMRVLLSTALIIYGFNKIYALQMPSPSIFKLSTPLGNLTPIELLWSFMGASPAYQSIAGWLEFIPGILLLFRRTQLLAALVAAGVLLNVWLMNMCYGVCVKILSFHLLATACIIVVPDASRLFQFFILQKAITPRNLASPWQSPWQKKLLSWGRIVWLGTVFSFVFLFVPYQLDYFSVGKADRAPQPMPLQGLSFYGRIWEVTGFRVEGSETLSRDPWRMVKLQGESGFVMTSLPNAGKEPYIWTLQPTPEIADGADLPIAGRMSVRTLSRGQMHSIYRSTDETDLPEPVGELQYRIEGSIANPLQAHFIGQLLLDGKPVEIQFTLIKPTLRRDEFILINTPFRWFQDYADASF